jgi:hypothetical protein
MILQDPPRKSQASISVYGRRVDEHQSSLLLLSILYFNWAELQGRVFTLGII